MTVLSKPDEMATEDLEPDLLLARVVRGVAGGVFAGAVFASRHRVVLHQPGRERRHAPADDVDGGHGVGLARQRRGLGDLRRAGAPRAVRPLRCAVLPRRPAGRARTGRCCWPPGVYGLIVYVVNFRILSPWLFPVFQDADQPSRCSSMCRTAALACLPGVRALSPASCGGDGGDPCDRPADLVRRRPTGPPAARVGGRRPPARRASPTSGGPAPGGTGLGPVEVAGDHRSRAPPGRGPRRCHRRRRGRGRPSVGLRDDRVEHRDGKGRLLGSVAVEEIVAVRVRRRLTSHALEVADAARTLRLKGVGRMEGPRPSATAGRASAGTRPALGVGLGVHGRGAARLHELAALGLRTDEQLAAERAAIARRGRDAGNGG